MEKESCDLIWNPYFFDASQALYVNYEKIYEKNLEWERRLAEPTWQLKKAVDWIADPKEWACGTVQKKEMPCDIPLHKKKIYETVIEGINNLEIGSIYQFEIQDHIVLPSDLLAFLDNKSVFIPSSCCYFLNCISKKVYSSVIMLNAKKKDPLSSGPRSRKKKARHEKEQLYDFLRVARSEVAKDWPISVTDLMERKEMQLAKESFTYAGGGKKKLSYGYLKNILLKGIPEIPKTKVGRPPKIR